MICCKIKHFFLIQTQENKEKNNSIALNKHFII